MGGDDLARPGVCGLSIAFWSQDRPIVAEKNQPEMNEEKPQGCPFYGTLSFTHRYSLERL